MPDESSDDGSPSDLEFPELESPTLIADGQLVVANGWSESSFEQAEYGPDQRSGINAQFESSSASLRVLPVEFQRRGRTETVEGLTADVYQQVSRSGIGKKPDVGPRTAFAVHLSYQTVTSHDTTFYTIAANGGDALAVACWLTAAEAAETTADLEEIVSIHAGKQVTTGQSQSDDERLAGSFADEPGRCLLTGKPTQSHEVVIPFRYAPLFEGYPLTYQDVPAVPKTVGGFRAAVSHTAWTKHDLGDDAFCSPVERTAKGRYALSSDVIEAVEDFPVTETGRVTLAER